MNPKIVIPARYQSTRFPGKPLVDIAGKSLIQRVWDRCCQVLSYSDVYIATDDEKIRNHCNEHKMQVIMTPNTCLTGTDRIYEASKNLDADFIVNVQGDEPLISPNDIIKVIDAHNRQREYVHCGMCPIRSEEDFRNPSVPKVVTKDNGKLMYISRAPIPTDKNLSFGQAMKQVCIYAFEKAALDDFGESNCKARLESIEDIEILRFFELGYDIEMIEVSESSIAVDFPEDVTRVIEAIKSGE